MMRARLFHRGLKLLVLLTAFALLFTVWYLTAYRPYGDPADDTANEALLEEHRENVEALLARAREIWGML